MGGGSADFPGAPSSLGVVVGLCPWHRSFPQLLGHPHAGGGGWHAHHRLVCGILNWGTAQFDLGGEISTCQAPSAHARVGSHECSRGHLASKKTLLVAMSDVYSLRAQPAQRGPFRRISSGWGRPISLRAGERDQAPFPPGCPASCLVYSADFYRVVWGSLSRGQLHEGTPPTWASLSLYDVTAMWLSLGS